MLSVSGVQQLIKRMIGPAVGHFELKIIEADKGSDVFEIRSVEKNRIEIQGTSETALASGFHWYLKHVCELHISWCGSRLALPAELPDIQEPICQVSPYALRYNLNYCTYSYSMAFWDWERWEQELDFMAMNGINLMLTVTGLEDVWRRTLLRLGYSEADVSDYLCGPAFFAWQWMQNLTSWGGPLPSWWYGEQSELAGKIRTRMRQLGIKPVVQGFGGMVPRNFKDKFPESSPIEQGVWCEFERPLLLLPEDPLFDAVASIYYDELYHLYGSDVHYYSIDPFHEGGHAERVDIAKYARATEHSLLKYDPEAVWVLQAWEGNPKAELLSAISRDHSLILDLWCESKPAWKETQAFQGHPWIWSMIQNYGGKNGLYGNLQTLASEVLAAKKSPEGGRMYGVGLAMEGIGTNPVMYDLLTDMIWREQEPRLEDWLVGYVKRRYGKAPNNALKAWRLLENSVYSSSMIQQGASESYLCARPALELNNVSTWGPQEISYDTQMVREACRLLYESYEDCHISEGYLYDLVDVTRQVLADYSRQLHSSMREAYASRNLQEFDVITGRFIQLLKDQDKLLSTREEFMLGPWLASARSLGRSTVEKDLFEWNARMLITLWGPETSAVVLRDYSHREWSGLISSFYEPRWTLFFETLREALICGEAPSELDWYSWEADWVRDTGKHFLLEPQGNIQEVVKHIISAYL